MLNVPEHSQQNTFTRVSFLINIVGILERWDLGTWESGLGTHMWDQRTRTLHLGPFTWEPVPGTHRRDPEPGTFTWDPAPVTLQLGHFIWARDPGPYIWEPGPNTFTWNAGPILNHYINTTFF